MNLRHKSAFIIALSLLVASASHAAAPDEDENHHEDVSLDSTLPVVKHEVVAGGVPFHGAGNVSPMEMFGINDAVAEQASKQLLKVLQTRLSTMVEMEPLPACAENKLEFRLTGGYSLQSKSFDFIFYDISNANDRMEATHWKGQAVPYSNDASWGINEEADPRVILAKMAHITCLPTRVHFVVRENNRLLEYRLGSKAWDRDTSASSSSGTSGAKK